MLEAPRFVCLVPRHSGIARACGSPRKTPPLPFAVQNPKWRPGRGGEGGTTEEAPGGPSAAGRCASGKGLRGRSAPCRAVPAGAGRGREGRRGRRAAISRDRGRPDGRGGPGQ